LQQLVTATWKIYCRTEGVTEKNCQKNVDAPGSSCAFFFFLFHGKKFVSLFAGETNQNKKSHLCCYARIALRSPTNFIYHQIVQ